LRKLKLGGWESLQPPGRRWDVETGKLRWWGKEKRDKGGKQEFWGQAFCFGRAGTKDRFQALGSRGVLIY
jgi:hypothetical protein